MKILVVSDTHGNTTFLRDVIIRQIDRVGMVIHLGDGEKDYESLIKNLGIPTYFVRGNCDFASHAPDHLVIEAEGKKLFITHGYKYSVKYGLSSAKSVARAHNADILLFGHTHNAVNEYDDGLYVVNPGSLSWHSERASYALIDVSSAGILANIVTL